MRQGGANGRRRRLSRWERIARALAQSAFDVLHHPRALRGARPVAGAPGREHRDRPLERLATYEPQSEHTGRGVRGVCGGDEFDTGDRVPLGPRQERGRVQLPVAARAVKDSAAGQLDRIAFVAPAATGLHVRGKSRFEVALYDQDCRQCGAVAAPHRVAPVRASIRSGTSCLQGRAVDRLCDHAGACVPLVFGFVRHREPGQAQQCGKNCFDHGGPTWGRPGGRGRARARGDLHIHRATPRTTARIVTLCLARTACPVGARPAVVRHRDVRTPSWSRRGRAACARETLAARGTVRTRLRSCRAVRP